MLSLVLSLHIILMIISLVTTISAVVITVSGRRIHSAIMRSDLAVTAVGLTAGTVLLLSAPLSVRCLMLVSYLAAFAYAYRLVTHAQAALTQDFLDN
ncbi:MAG: hypothetical protein JWM00_570 [Candidatus Saccharibacteria bacterium]|nr:hypothetical protein [Candidatus Saccharibacteria bacterium]